MTTRGRTLAALSVSMLLFGRLGGMRELIMAGAAFALVLAAGFVLVWVRGGRVGAQRKLDPAKTLVGGGVRVELSVEANGHLGLGPLLLADRIPRVLGQSPRVALSGSAQRRSRSVAYQLTPRMRGRHTIGPLELTLTDPFGAVRRRREVPGSSSLLVLPSYEDITTLPTGVQRVGIVRNSPLVGQGDEFYALRAYEEGDDLRKIHWPTSLRTDQLVIRQEELLAEPRALIVLDTTAAKHRGRGPTSSLEAAVSACAAIGVLAVRRRMRIEVVTPDGPILNQRAPSVDQFLQALAVVEPSERPSLAKSLEHTASQRPGRPALLVVISPGLRRDELRAVAARARGSAAGAIVLIDTQSFDARPAERMRRPPIGDLALLALPIVRLRAGDSFRHVWHTGIKGVSLAR
ncbi:MAG: DUF58 domain-containing protein [Actinomycetota bacterium]